MFLQLTILTNDEPLIVSLAAIVAVQGTSNGSSVYVAGGLNQWYQVKEAPSEIQDLIDRDVV